MLKYKLKIRDDFLLQTFGFIKRLKQCFGNNWICHNKGMENADMIRNIKEYLKQKLLSPNVFYIHIIYIYIYINSLKIV